MTERTGGCLCGAIRYRLLSEPYDTGWCHCDTCRRFSGSPAMTFSTVPLSDWQVETGAEHIRKVKTSSFGERQFCGKCGTGLTIHIDFQPDEIDFTVCTLDDPGDVRPGFHIFTGSRVPWFDPQDGLPRYERYRPDTRGLGGTEPPE